MDAPWRYRTKLIQGPPGPGKAVFSGSAPWTPGTISSGASATTPVTVANAVVGQSASVGFTPALPAGVILSTAITSAGVATVTLFNLSGSPVTIGAGTAWVDVTVH